MKHSDIVSLVIHGVALPLINAVSNGQHGHDEDTVVEHVAELLTLASTTVALVDQESALQETPLVEVSARIDLLATCCQILARDYTQNNKVPSAEGLKRHAQSLNALLSAHGMQAIHSGKTQEGLKFAYLEGYGPMIEAVHNFSFTQNENKMITEVTQKVESFVEAVIQKVYSEAVQENVRFHIRSALLSFYGASHMCEVNRIVELNDYQRDREQSHTQIENIWTNFGLRQEMLSVIAYTMREDNIPKTDQSEEIELTDHELDELLGLEEEASNEEETLVQLNQQANDDNNEEDGDDSPMSFYKSK